MTKWCNNCETDRESYADRGNYSGHKPYNRCWSCNKWFLVNSDAKNLYDWWGNGIEGYQKDAIANLGVDASIYSKKRYSKWDLLKLYYWSEIFKRNEQINDLNIKEKILKVNFFSSWWNNNLILVLTDNSEYKDYCRLYLIVYEMPLQSTGNPSLGLLESVSIFDAASLGYDYLISSFQEKLQSDSPITANMGPLTRSGSFMIMVEKDDGKERFPMYFLMNQFLDKPVKRIDLTNTDAWSNPNRHIKPLDIVLVINNQLKMVHSCVYLGWDKNKNEYKIAHALGREGGVVRTDNWNKFLRTIDPNRGPDKLIRYHPLIIFKKPELIIEHIARSVVGKSGFFLVKDKDQCFSIYWINCEVFANACVLGLNFSELNERNSSKELRKTENVHRNWFSNTVDMFFFYHDRISKSIEDTNHKFNNIEIKNEDKELLNDTKRDIKDYRRWADESRVERSVDREGIEMQCYIEVQPKSGFGFGSDISSLFGRMNI